MSLFDFIFGKKKNTPSQPSRPAQTAGNSRPANNSQPARPAASRPQPQGQGQRPVFTSSAKKGFSQGDGSASVQTAAAQPASGTPNSNAICGAVAHAVAAIASFAKERNTPIASIGLGSTVCSVLYAIKFCNGYDKAWYDQHAAMLSNHLSELLPQPLSDTEYNVVDGLVSNITKASPSTAKDTLAVYAVCKVVWAFINADVQEDPPMPEDFISHVTMHIKAMLGAVKQHIESAAAPAQQAAPAQNRPVFKPAPGVQPQQPQQPQQQAAPAQNRPVFKPAPGVQPQQPQQPAQQAAPAQNRPVFKPAPSVQGSSPASSAALTPVPQPATPADVALNHALQLMNKVSAPAPDFAAHTAGFCLAVMAEFSNQRPNFLDQQTAALNDLLRARGAATLPDGAAATLRTSIHEKRTSGSRAGFLAAAAPVLQGVVNQHASRCTMDEEALQNAVDEVLKAYASL